MHQPRRIPGHLRQAGRVRTHHRRSARHRFQHRQTEAFVTRQQRQHIGILVGLHQGRVVQVAVPLHQFRHSQPPRGFRRLRIARIRRARDAQPRIHAARPHQPGKHRHQPRQILVGIASPHVEDGFRPAARRRLLAARPIPRIHPVRRDDDPLARHPQEPHDVAFCRFASRRHHIDPAGDLVHQRPVDRKKARLQRLGREFRMHHRNQVVNVAHAPDGMRAPPRKHRQRHHEIRRMVHSGAQRLHQPCGRKLPPRIENTVRQQGKGDMLLSGQARLLFDGGLPFTVPHQHHVFKRPAPFPQLPQQFQRVAPDAAQLAKHPARINRNPLGLCRFHPAKSSRAPGLNPAVFANRSSVPSTRPFALIPACCFRTSSPDRFWPVDQTIRLHPIHLHPAPHTLESL